MKTVTITLYKFDELPAEVQEKAISKYSAINVDYSWWDYIYEDAWNVNLKITEFDLDRKYDIKGSLLYEPANTAIEILNKHGKDTDTHQLAEQYFSEYRRVKFKYSDDIVSDVPIDKLDDFEEDLEPYNEQFEVDLLNCYWRMLRDEYEYLTSEEQIKETLIANEYDFTIEGEIY